MEKIAVKCDIWMPAHRQCLWHVMTDPQYIGKWWTPDQWKIPAMQVGALVKFGHDPDAAYAIIKVLDKPRQFSLLWKSNIPNAKQMTTFILSDDGEGTRVTVIQTGFEALHEDIRQQWMDKTVEGYTIVLENLKALHTYLMESMLVMEGT
jgi:uncharacterized protein YndB with AHSA1/START domain